MWEERWHPLRKQWVIVAAYRQSRWWSGAEVPRRVPAVRKMKADSLPALVNVIAWLGLCPRFPALSLAS